MALKKELRERSGIQSDMARRRARSDAGTLPTGAKFNERGRWRPTRRHRTCRLFRRSDANRDQWGIGCRTCRTARRTALAEELRLIAGRPAIGRHQDLIVLTLHGTARYAVRFDHANAWGRRPGLALRTRRPGWARRPCGTGRTCITFGSLWSRRTWVALRALAAGRQRPRYRQ